MSRLSNLMVALVCSVVAGMHSRRTWVFGSDGGQIMRPISIFVACAFVSLPVAFADPPAPLPETGQTMCFDATGTEIICSETGQDGDLRKGVKWPVPRLTDNGDGTVTDNLTGIIWLQYAMCFKTDWVSGLGLANNLADGNCGLADGSQPGAWRMPNIVELRSIIDFNNKTPALPPGHPFLPTGIQAGNYWSSTTVLNAPVQAHALFLADGTILGRDKIYDFPYVWAVRDASAPPTQCSDGIDNDNDGWIDLEDRQCRSPDQNSEKNRNR